MARILEEWGDQPDPDPPLYLALGDLARHLVCMLERGDSAGLVRALAVVERWHLEGDAYVREAATIGLLEDLQNGNLHPNGTRPEQFEPLLGPESRVLWDELNAFWAGTIPYVGAGRTLTEASCTVLPRRAPSLPP